MKWVTKSISRGLRLVVPVLALLATQQAFAVGTPAGDTVSNTASVSYFVGGNSQDPIDSAPAVFTVDRLVDFTLIVTDAVSTDVVPGGEGIITSLLLTNLGNAPQDFLLSALNIVGGSVNGVADAFDMDTPIQVWADLDGNGVVSAGDTEWVDELSADDSGTDNQVALLIVADAPSSPTPANDTGATVELTVTAAEGVTAGGTGGASAIASTAGGDVIGGAAQVVVGTGVLSVQDGFIVSSPAITVSKASEVISDPFNLLVDPKAIPGAVVEYEITATNAGSEDATAIGFFDDIGTQPVALELGGYGGLDAEVVYDGVTYTCTLDAGDTGTTDGCGLFGTEVRIAPTAIPGGITLNASGGAVTSAIARFQVQID